MSSLIRVSIDLTKIDKSKIKNHTNGSKYLELVIDEKREADQYGNTHAVYINQTKEEREKQVKRCYLGNGKIYHFGNNNAPQQTNTQQSAPPPHANDDLPF